MLPTDQYLQTASLQDVPPNVDCGFKIFDKPHPQIARALLGPFPVENSKVRVDIPMRCLAVNASGTYAACVRVEPYQLWNATALWKYIAWQLNVRSGHQTCEPRWAGAKPYAKSPTDSLNTWTEPGFWCDRHFDDIFADHSLRWAPYAEGTNDKAAWQAMIRDCVSETLLVLDPRLRALLYARPLIRMSIVRILLNMASQRGSAAIDHAWVALAREPLPLLHLMACGVPASPARRVRNTVFKGGDLAGLLKKMGIPELTFRRARRSGCHIATDKQCNPRIEKEFAVEWSVWFNLMKITHRNPLISESDWLEFCNLLSPNRGLYSWGTVIARCIEIDYKKCNERWDIFNEAIQQIAWSHPPPTLLKEIKSFRPNHHFLKNHSPEHIKFAINLIYAHLSNIQTLKNRVIGAIPEVPHELENYNSFIIRRITKDTIKYRTDFFRRIRSRHAKYIESLAMNTALYEVHNMPEYSEKYIFSGIISLHYVQSENIVEFRRIIEDDSNGKNTTLNNIGIELTKSYNSKKNKREWLNFMTKCRLLTAALYQCDVVY